MATLRSTTLPRTWYGPLGVVLLGAVLALLALVPGRASAVRPAVSSSVLVGTLQLTPGSCAGGKATGTYLRMILPSGSTNGPYMSNSDSRCADQSFTTLSPGTDGGLRVGSYQPVPTPAFSPSGDARARRITAPTAFYGTSFATATNAVDPQTKRSVPAPRLTLTGSSLTADLRSFSVTWNNQHFNQGAPKPDGSSPGNTRIATGSYDAATGAFTLDWTSQVVGGPFDKFTGKWHLTGHFVPAAGGAPVSHAQAQPGTTGTAGTGSSAPDPVGSGTPGQPAGKPSAGSTPVTTGALAGTPAAAAPEAAPATTRTVITQKWHVSTPVLGLAIGIALLGIGALVLLTILGRRAEPV